MLEINSLGSWIKSRRKALGLTQRELAHLTNCSLSTIVKIESDQRRPSRQVAALLAEQLNIPNELLEKFINIARGQQSITQLETMPVELKSALQPLPKKPIYNLPAPPNPLIGRAEELAEIVDLLIKADCRMLTITGPIGVGKTRLAVEAATKLKATAAEQFPDGIYFVSLASLNDPRFIPHAVVQSIDLSFSGSETPEDQMNNFLRDKTLLLLMDNAEHLAQGMAIFSSLIEQSPGIKLLVTSQQRLNLIGEWVFVLQGLPVPPADDFEEIENYNSVKFFIQRAKQSQFSFSLTERDHPHIVQICRMLDGMPLGIELAASWVRVLGVNEIASEIARDLDFLTSPAQDVPVRHRSLRIAFEHSWKLLSKVERRALRLLSVFRGGFTREAASQVADIPLPLLGGLMDKSLLRRDEHSRYNLHELVRQYSAQFLAENEHDELNARLRHSQYYLSMLQDLEDDLHGNQQRQAMDRLIPEIDNLRAGWRCAVETGRADLIQQASWSLWFFYEVRGYYREGETRFNDAIEMVNRHHQDQSNLPDELGSIDLNRLLGELMMFQAHFILRLNRYAQAEHLLSTSISLLKSAGSSISLAHALANYAVLNWSIGDYDKAWTQVEEALTLSMEFGDTWQTTFNNALKGVLHHERGEYQQAYKLLETAMHDANLIGDPRQISFIASYFSRTALKLDRGNEVRPLLDEALRLAMRIEDRFRIGLILEQLALIAESEDNTVEAERLFTQAIDLYQELGHSWSVARLLVAKGHFELSQLEIPLAQEHFGQALRSALKSNTLPRALDACAGLAKCFKLDGDFDTAFRLALQVEKHPARTQDTSVIAKQIMSEAKVNLSKVELRKIEKESQSQDFDKYAQAILEGIKPQ